MRPIPRHAATNQPSYLYSSLWAFFNAPCLYSALAEWEQAAAAAAAAAAASAAAAAAAAAALEKASAKAAEKAAAKAAKRELQERERQAATAAAAVAAAEAATAEAASAATDGKSEQASDVAMSSPAPILATVLASARAPTPAPAPALALASAPVPAMAAVPAFAPPPISPSHSCGRLSLSRRYNSPRNEIELAKHTHVQSFSAWTCAIAADLEGCSASRRCQPDTVCMLAWSLDSRGG